MYLNYDWSKYPQVIKFLNNIYENTITFLKENEYDEKYAQEFISDIEDFLYYFTITTDYNINGIVHKLQEIEKIEFYDTLLFDKTGKDDSIKFPPVINRYTSIMINTGIEGDKRLSARERRRLYLYKGLAHSLIRMKSSETLYFSGLYSNYLETDQELTEIIVNNGWLLLEEGLAQELAEKITYYTLDRVRPGYRPGLEDEKFSISGSKISSNLEMCRVFQPLIAHFGLTIGRIADLYDYSEGMIIKDLLKYSITDSLSHIAIAEYNGKRNNLELYQMLYLMGLLVDEMYKQHHFGFINGMTLEEEDCNKIFDNILEMTNRLVSFEKTDYSNTSPIIIAYDFKTREKVLRLINHHEI